MEDILNQLSTVIKDWSSLGALAGLIATVNLLTNLLKLERVKAKWPLDKKWLPWVAIFLGMLGGFLTALSTGKPVPQALVSGFIVGLGAIGTHEVATQMKTKPPTNTAVLVLIAGLGLGLPQLSACGGHNPLPVVADALIDCTKANRVQVEKTVNELSPLLDLEKPDMSMLYQRAKHAGVAIGGCALAELVQTYLGGRKAPPTPQAGWDMRSVLEKFRAEEAGGTTFKTLCTQPDGSQEPCNL